MSKDVMFLFQRAMRRWLPWIKRATYAANVAIEPRKNGEFFLKVVWPATKAGAAGEHKIYFSRYKVLGATSLKGKLCQRTTKKVCRFRDDVVREVLQKRGIG